MSTVPERANALIAATTAATDMVMSLAEQAQDTIERVLELETRAATVEALAADLEREAAALKSSGRRAQFERGREREDTAARLRTALGVTS